MDARCCDGDAVAAAGECSVCEICPPTTQAHDGLDRYDVGAETGQATEGKGIFRPLKFNVTNRRAALLIAVLAFFLIVLGLGKVMTPFLEGVIWAFIHDAGSILSLVVGIAALLIPLVAAGFGARAIYAWTLGEPEAPARYRRPGAKVLVGWIGMLSVVGHIEIVRELTHLPPRIQDSLVLAKGMYMPSNPVVSGDRVYWIDNSETKRSLMSIGRADKKPSRLAPVQYYAWRLFSDGDALYWKEDLKIVRFKLPDGPVEKVDEPVSADPMAFDGQYVYWAPYSPISVGDSAILSRVARTGGKSSEVVHELPCCSGETPAALAVDQQYVFWTDSKLNAIFRARKDRGERELLLTKQHEADAILVDEGNLFWTTLGTFNGDHFNPDGAVVRARTDGTESMVLLSGLLEPTALAVDEVNVYVACPDHILRVAKSGGTPTTVVDNQFHIVGLQVDNEFVYWSDERGAVYHIKKQ
jgi:hypothetical protein